MFSKEIDTKGNNGPGEIKLNAIPKRDPAFAMEQMLLKLSFTLTNANTTTAKVFGTESDWDRVKLKILKRDGKPIVNSISLKTLEALVQVVTSGFVFTPVKFIDISVAASSSVDVSTDIIIPFRLAQMLLSGSDLDLSLDIIGDCSVLIPAPSLSDLTLSTPSVSLIAVGHRDHNGHVMLGPTLEWNESSITATTEDAVGMGGDKMVALALISRDKTSYPISKYAGLTMGVDSDKPIVELPTMPVDAIALANGDIYSQVQADNARESVTHGVALFRPHGLAKISELPEGAAMQLRYTTADAIVLQKFVYGSILLREPPVKSAEQAIPAFQAAVARHGYKGLGAAGVAYRPHLDNAPNGPAPASTFRFLPLQLRLPGIAPGAVEAPVATAAAK